MNIIFMGPPGSGKGTMAERLLKKYSLRHLSTGEILRENIHKGTELGNLARGYIEKGQLVPDDVIIGMVEKELSRSDAGVLFDGFPRTAEQARVLLTIADIDAVIEFEASLELVSGRVLGRAVCEDCEKVFNRKFYSADTCDACGGKLYHRSDDTLETIKSRYEVYQKYAEDIKHIFADLNILYSLDADDSIDHLEELITAILDKKAI